MTFPILSDLPAGYFVEESPRGVLAVQADATRLLHAAGYGPETDGELEESELAGRRPLYRLGAGADELVVRRFSHGGLARFVTRERFLDPERPFRELILSDALRRVGIRTPRVVAARALSARGGGFLLDVLTRRVPDALDVGAVLARLRRGELDPRGLRGLWVAVGELARQLHQNGCLHADLTPRNVLVERSSLGTDEPRVWILDLDRSVVHRSLSEPQRRRNLRRLYRYVERRDARYGRSVSRTDCARFFRGYDPELARWKECWRAVEAAHARTRPLHRLGWMLERVLGGGGPSPDRPPERGLLYPVASVSDAAPASPESEGAKEGASAPRAESWWTR